MVPLFKLFSLLLKLFSRPIANNFKNAIKMQPEHHPFLRAMLVGLGQKYHVFMVRIQRQSMKMAGANSYIKPLTEDKAIETGAELIGEMIAYGVLIGFGVYELIKMQRENKRKEAAQLERIALIHAKIDGVDQEYRALLALLKASKLAKTSQTTQASDETAPSFQLE